MAKTTVTTANKAPETKKPELHLEVTRLFERANGKVGVLLCQGDERVKLFTLEDLDRGNAKNISCIPVGTYKCKPHGWELNSGVKHKRTWEIQDVPGRKDVLLHIGNSHIDTQGCILVGVGITLGREEPFLQESTRAVDLLRSIIGENGFTLTIK